MLSNGSIQICSFFDRRKRIPSFWWTTNRSKVDLRSVLMKLAGDGRGIRGALCRAENARKSRSSLIPDIGINSTIKHSAGPVHKVIAIAPRALQRADLWTGVAYERKSNPLGTRSTENRLHMCCSRHASPRNSARCMLTVSVLF